MTFIQGIGSRYAVLDEDDVALGQVHISDLILGIVYHGLRGVEIIIAIIVKRLETICGNTLIGNGVIPLRWKDKETVSCKELREIVTANLTALNIVFQVVCVGWSKGTIIC